jgi:hypothetical protein
MNTQVTVDKLQKTKKGQLRIMRTGVLYQDDGTVSYVPESVLRDAAPNFKNTPLRNEHEGEIVGVITDAYYEAPYLKGNYIIYADGLSIQNQEISAGYYIMPENMISGIWQDDMGIMGEKGKSYEFDSTYTKILPNHVAIVPRGRAGANVRLNVDSLNLDKTLEDNTMRRTILKSDAKKVKEEETPIVADDPTVEELPIVEEVVADEPIIEPTVEEVVSDPVEEEPVVEVASEAPAYVELSAFDAVLELVKQLNDTVDSIAGMRQDAIATFEVENQNKFKRRLGLARMVDRLGIEASDDELASSDEAALTGKIANILGIDIDESLDAYSQISMAIKLADQIAEKRVDSAPTIVTSKTTEPKARVVYNERTGITTLYPKNKK